MTNDRMTNESMHQHDQEPEGGQPQGQEGNVEQTPMERMASSMYAQAGEAANAFRRGELLQDSQIDPLADSDDRLIAMLSYVTQLVLPVVMPLIVLLSESSKKRPFQRYHAVQSLAFVLLFWLIFMAASIAIGILQIIPVLGWLIGVFALICLTPIYFLAGIGLLLYYGLQAYKGRRFAIPGLTSFLRDQNWLQ
ncbi:MULTISPECIES: DUF4870 domain-containing protein [Caldilinea]|jgi:uncharacterized membrane protein|nr:MULTISPECIES: DUF4870 domain-containing protein [Caldilinea]MBO9394982.1 DUF4870 domain-containing protein [Caldilinea sp.]GIV74397.1 MAG: hypothetical protein KatS3mg049_2953 [Caldilinea sp.]